MTIEEKLLNRCLHSQKDKPRSYKSQSKITKRRRRLTYQRDGYQCLKCGTYDNLSIDHIVPLSKGGLKKRFNLQTLCNDCNNEKGDKIISYVKKKNC